MFLVDQRRRDARRARPAGPATWPARCCVDVSNPLDFSAGFPPTLSVNNTDSLGEQIQRAFPGARVVKSLNTMNASVMVRPDSLSASRATAFVSGDDEEAKAAVTGLLESFGHTDVIDLGDISTARGPRCCCRVGAADGSARDATFNMKVVR